MAEEQTDLDVLTALFREMLETRAWREYEKIVQAQIKQREAVILAPFHTIKEAQGLDQVQKMGAVESLKGAVLGLRLAVETPYLIIQDAQKREKVTEDE